MLVLRMLNNCRCDETAATAIEYALIATFIAMACVVVWGQVGTSVSTAFSNVANNL